MKIKVLIYCLISLATTTTTSIAKDIKKSNPVSYLEMRSQYCKEKILDSSIKAGTPCRVNAKNKSSTISELSIILACQNYYNENNCSEVKESVGIVNESLLMSCLPKDICKDFTDLNIVECSIEGAMEQFEIPSLLLSAGISFGFGLAGVATEATIPLVLLPVLTIAEGKKAEACNSDLKYKKMAVKMHNMNLLKNERALDVEGADKNVLKMQCRDLEKFLKTRLDVFAEKKLENSRWSMSPLKVEKLTAEKRAYLDTIHSKRCYSTKELKKSMCETISEIATGAIIRKATGFAGKKTKTILNAITVPKKH